MHGVGEKDSFNGLRSAKGTEEGRYAFCVKVATESLEGSRQQHQIGVIDLVGRKATPRLLASYC